MNWKCSLITLQAILISALLTTAAEDGKKLYAQMCAACHGDKGQGIGNGVFPPLQDSKWLKGNPSRVAQILLHGIKGPVTVKGKSYNLAMPAQGSLSDADKVKVIRFIKKEFANEESTFSLTDLLDTKKQHQDRTQQWTSKELLKLYPFPTKKSPITNLIMKVYHGKWRQLPDLSKLKAAAVEEEHNGFISLNNINSNNNFALLWTGDINVPNDGTYQLELTADDGASVSIAGKEIARINHKGMMHPSRAQKGTIKLTKGTHKIKVEYFQFRRNRGISIKWTNPAITDKSQTSQWLTEKNIPRRAAPVIDITPTDNKTRMYQNFITGSTHRTMAVGFPHGHNIAFSTQNCQPDIIWKGRFIDAGKHWTGRGQGTQAPLSNDIINLGKGIAWSSDTQTLNLKLLGYTMDKNGNPTFNYKTTNSDLIFKEQYTPKEKSLTRNITIIAKQDQKITLRLTTDEHTISEKTAYIDKKLIINSPNLQSDKNKLFSVIDLKKGLNTYKIQYSWTK